MEWARSSTATCTCRRFMGLPFFDGAGGGRTGGGVAVATVFREVGEQGAHGRVRGCVDEGAAFAARGDEGGVFEVAEVEGKRGGGECEAVGDEAGGQALRAGLNEEAVDI